MKVFLLQNPVAYFLNLPLEDAVGTDTVGTGMLQCQLWKR